ncbi:MAG: hypothetical protein Q8O84_02750 [Nanoarchaeota archaeon]|nr:hypothetical protein [Nanoarchaeota archaeon]
MGKLKNTLFGASLVGLLSLGWCNYRQSDTIDKQETKIDSLRDNNLNLTFYYNNLKNSYTDSKNKTKFYSDSLEKTLNLYSKTNSEIKTLNQLLGRVKGELKKYKTVDNMEKVALLEKYDSLFQKHGFAEKEIKKQISEINRLENAIKNKGGSDWEKKYGELKIVYDKSYGENNLEEAVRDNISEYSQNSDREFSLKVKDDKGFFENLFESKRPKLKKMGEKYVVFKDDSPEGMQAFVVDSEGRQNPLKKMDNQGIFSYSHINFRDGQYIFYAMDKDNNESPKYIYNISGGVISKKKLD